MGGGPIVPGEVASVTSGDVDYEIPTAHSLAMPAAALPPPAGKLFEVDSKCGVKQPAVVEGDVDGTEATSRARATASRCVWFALEEDGQLTPLEAATEPGVANKPVTHTARLDLGRSCVVVVWFVVCVVWVGLYVVWDCDFVQCAVISLCNIVSTTNTQSKRVRQ